MEKFLGKKKPLFAKNFVLIPYKKLLERFKKRRENSSKLSFNILQNKKQKE